MQLKHTKKTCAVYGEGAVTDCVKSGLRRVVLETSLWTMLCGGVDELK